MTSCLGKRSKVTGHNSSKHASMLYVLYVTIFSQLVDYSCPDLVKTSQPSSHIGLLQPTPLTYTLQPLHIIRWTLSIQPAVSPKQGIDDVLVARNRADGLVQSGVSMVRSLAIHVSARLHENRYCVGVSRHYGNVQCRLAIFVHAAWAAALVNNAACIVLSLYEQRSRNLKHSLHCRAYRQHTVHKLAQCSA